MASIHRRGARYIVRHRCPKRGGRNRAETCPTKRVAEARRLEIEAALALGRQCCKPAAAATRRVTLMDGCAAYLRARSRVVGAGRMRILTRSLGRLAEAAAVRCEVDVDSVPLSELDRDLLAAAYDTARAGGCNALTARKALADMMAAWRWLRDEYPDVVAKPREVPVAAGHVEHQARAASWEVLDQPIVNALGRWATRYVRAAIVCRFMGLRKAQAARLRTADLDRERLRLVIRRGDEKRAARGRVVPVSQAMLDALDLAGPAGERFIGDDGEPFTDSVFADMWEATSVPAAVWTGQPAKIYRVSVTSHLRAAGVPGDLVRYLVGHKLVDVNLGVYTDFELIEPRLREAIAHIPPLHHDALAMRRAG